MNIIDTLQEAKDAIESLRTKALIDQQFCAAIEIIAQQRASRNDVYTSLLRRWGDALNTWRDENAAPCPICGNADWFNGAHDDGCLVTDTHRALAADADEIARLLGEWAQGRGA